MTRFGPGVSISFHSAMPKVGERAVADRLAGDALDRRDQAAECADRGQPPPTPARTLPHVPSASQPLVP